MESYQKDRIRLGEVNKLENGAMVILVRVRFLAVPVAAIAWGQPGAKADRCDDVNRLDFKNLVVRTQGRSFAFHNGFALNIDDGPEGKPDWKAEIETDKVIRPAPGGVVRFLVILDEHQTGIRRGAGKRQEVLQRSGALLGIDRLDSPAIGIGLNVTPSRTIRRQWSYTGGAR